MDRLSGSGSPMALVVSDRTR
ncbi:hypothetical protein SAM23877_3274 [Streptomyces ambofaciens ATCC 23877]|uniref:Uncharacterized protein n=1 Tax=Streptomyces ambofaciens (strain ATCC 23877 / 3486 / DSM 40053 / JCM 4204 / NBRC 12836 / NRRL B-2516) TaxID=278992 RepID=A0A0K2ATS6_STRA7|nr:hypothetical protein SAM23877_3274 [Streptomyces ambofaciens ATCC 23877]